MVVDNSEVRVRASIVELAKSVRTGRMRAKRNKGGGRRVERARIDFGGKDSNDAGIGLRRVCVESAEVSEGLYDEFRIR